MTSTRSTACSGNVTPDKQPLSETGAAFFGSIDSANMFTSTDLAVIYGTADYVGEAESNPSTAFAGNARESFRSNESCTGLMSVGGVPSVASQSFLAHLLTSKDSVFDSKDALYDILNLKSVDAVPFFADDCVLPGVYESGHWLPSCRDSHTDIDYTQSIFESRECASGSTTLRTANLAEDCRCKWFRRYVATLANPIAGTSCRALVISQQSNQEVTKKNECSSRCPDSKKKAYVQYTDLDILSGRGGLSNKHLGNEYYRAVIEAAKPDYRVMAKYEKTILSEKIVEDMNKQCRRFLKQDTNGNWFEISKMAARRKVGQALREENTPEARAEKRKRYSSTVRRI